MTPGRVNTFCALVALVLVTWAAATLIDPVAPLRGAEVVEILR